VAALTRPEIATPNPLRTLLGNRYARWLARVIGAVLCFAIAIVLTIFPGPAVPFWILGFVLLGFSVGQLLMSVHAFQDWLHRHVPAAQGLPRLRKRHIRRVLRHRWVRALERWTHHRERRRRAARERRRHRGVAH
jgi:hypothetical protein